MNKLILHAVEWEERKNKKTAITNYWKLLQIAPCICLCNSVYAQSY